MAYRTVAQKASAIGLRAEQDLQRRRIEVEDMARLLTRPASPEAKNVLKGQTTGQLEGQVPEGPSDTVSAPTRHQEEPLENAGEKSGI